LRPIRPKKQRNPLIRKGFRRAQKKENFLKKKLDTRRRIWYTASQGSKKRRGMAARGRKKQNKGRESVYFA
jgi:hypothetical protein